MEKSTVEFKDMDTEAILHDVMHIICHHLELSDLLSATRLCKSWYMAATQEIAKIGPERLLLPYSYCEFIKNKNCRFHISQVVQTIPTLTLLFTTQKSFSITSSPSFDILKLYEAKYGSQRGKVLVVAGEECRIDENEVNSITNSYSEQSLNGILGMLLPLHGQLKVRVTWCKSEGYSHNLQDKIDKFIDKIAPEDEDLNFALIIFTKSKLFYGFAYHVQQEFQIRFQDKMYSLWGGSFIDLHKADNSVNIDTSIENSRINDFGLSISGPKLRAWSTVIYLRNSKNYVNQKLSELKARVQIRRCNIGLVCGPSFAFLSADQNSEYKDSYHFMKDVKTIFPGVDFIAIFNFNIVFGFDSQIDRVNQDPGHYMTASVMILTYD